MSGFDSLLDKVRRAYAAIGEVEEVAARFPGDILVLANLASLKRDARDLEILWEEDCARSRVEVCRYRLLPETQERYSLADVSRSLLEFQNLFSQVFSALKKGIRKRTRLSADMLDESAFQFGFSYPGSLGIAMMADGENELFDAKYGSTIEAFLSVISVKNEDDVRKIAESLGQAVVKRAYDWSRVNANAGYGIDVKWTRAEGVQVGGMVGASSFMKIVNLIEMTSDKEISTIESRGILRGIDTSSGRFHFVTISDVHYSGTVAENFDLRPKWAVNTEYKARIIIEATTEYATQETKQIFRLEALEYDP